MTKRASFDAELKMIAVATKMNDYLLKSYDAGTLDEKHRIYQQVTRYLRQMAGEMRTIEERARKEMIESHFAGRLIEDDEQEKR